MPVPSARLAPLPAAPPSRTRFFRRPDEVTDMRMRIGAAADPNRQASAHQEPCEQIEEPHVSRAFNASAAACPPPALSPATAMRVGLMPNAAAYSCIQRSAA